MSHLYTDTVRRKVIEDTTAAIGAYLEQRAKRFITASDLPAHLYEFFGGTYYEDGLQNYPEAAAAALAALTKKEVLDPVVAAMGDYSFEWLVKILTNTIELTKWIEKNPANIAEFEYHAYGNYEPSQDTESIKRDMIKYQALLKYEQEIEAGEAELSGKRNK